MPKPRGDGRYVVATVDEIEPGQRKIVEIEGRSIGVFNIEGEFFALLNRCPHQAAPLCRGPVIRSTLPSEPGEYRMREKADIVRCPWHGWEFHIPSGESIFDPVRCKVRTYDVTVEPADRSLVTADESEWPRAETYPVTIEADEIVVHIKRRRAHA